MRKLVIVALCGVFFGLVVGWFAGRWALERYWTQPLVLKRLAQSDVERARGPGADPTPPAATIVLRPAPLALSRLALAELTRRDPVLVTLGDVGTGDSESRLNLDLVNRGRCKVRDFSGVAYGYDAYGRPSRMNKGGEHYVAFNEHDAQDFAPTSTHAFAMTLHHNDSASLVVAQVDRVVCQDGKTWSRN